MKESDATVGEFKSGLTARSLLALVYLFGVFEPVTIWFFLMTYRWEFAMSAGWLAFILIGELARMYGKPLTRQEAFIMVNTAGAITTSGIFISLIYQAYFKHQDPFVKLSGIAEKVPPWFAPGSIEAWQNRTFLDPLWLAPIAMAVTWIFLSFAADISMGLIARGLYVEVEKLPFPVQEVTAQGIITVVEREPRRVRMFTFGLDVGLLLGFIIYAAPFIAQALNLPTIPISSYIPWLDLNPSIHSYIKGASFGIYTDPIIIATGIVVPFSVVTSMFIGSFAINFVGNALLVNYGITEFAKEWFPSMSISMTLWRSWIHAWMSPSIGILIAAGVMPLIYRPRVLIEAFKGLAGVTKVRERVASLWILLALWLGASIGSIVIVSYLVPGYPIIFMLIFSIGWSFFWTVIGARAIGMTGQNVSPPGILGLMKYGYIASSGYQGVDIWFIDPVISLGGADFCASFKVAELCNCTAKSYVKARILVLPIVVILGFLYTELFWRMFPMPEGMFPATNIYWPFSAAQSVLWMGGQRGGVAQIIPEWIGIGFAVTAALFLVTAFAHIPFSVIGFAVGATTPIPLPVGMLIGAGVGKMLEWKFGKERWGQAKSVLVAGLILGVIMMLLVGSAFYMITKSTWYLPY